VHAQLSRLAALLRWGAVSPDQAIQDVDAALQRILDGDTDTPDDYLTGT
jgi:hypothetical protein